MSLFLWFNIKAFRFQAYIICLKAFYVANLL